MSKFSNLLKLITLLKSNDRIKRKEIAEALGVSERMVRKYILDLQEANINIESVAGPQGGYVLRGYNYLVEMDINEDEIYSIDKAIERLIDKDFEEINSLKKLSNKIKGNSENIESKKKDKIVRYTDKDEYEIELQSASITRNKLKISYNSITSGDTVRVIHPYAVVTINDMRYFIAYCENRKEIITFKVVRINWIEKLDDKFEISEGFDIKEYMKDGMGVFRDIVDVKLLIRKPFSHPTSERVYSENQKITWNDDESIVFEASMRGKKDIIRWILGMGEYVTVVEPEFLKNELREKLEKMLKNI